jgi:hypothetical protein
MEVIAPARSRSDRVAILRTVARGAGRLTARATTGVRMLPTFLIVGAKRSGSTSLFEYVSSHPGVSPCHVKKGTHYFDVNFGRGWGWFRSSFPVAVPGKITGEASPYYMFHPLAATRIAAALPEARLIAVLRDPVTRAHSHYQYERRRGFEDLSLDEALDREEERLAGEAERMVADPTYASFEHRHHAYLARGRYAEQLEAIRGLFPAERLLVVQSEAMFADPNAAIGRVWDFLGLPQHTLGQVQAFKAGSYDSMPERALARLGAYYAEPNERLYALPGINFRWPHVATPSTLPAQAGLSEEPSLARNSADG